ncbi:MAG TPA: hypothetical protein VGX92_04330 [Pyrinomonadaceae bacterium]|nr:hypothetical protein [Pyrinomonadaceae bacterium]
MEIQIAVTSQKPIEEIKQTLESQLDPNGSDVKLELRKRKAKFRSMIDPTILVAIVGAASVGLGSLITGLLQVGQQLAARKIVLEAQGGAKLEVPANTSLDQIDQYIDRLNQMGEVKKISVQ